MLQNSPRYAYIPAKDVSRRRRFYEQKLGFKPGKELAGGVLYEFGKGTACVPRGDSKRIVTLTPN
jgi:extradiol dioxygenase family protein